MTTWWAGACCGRQRKSEDTPRVNSEMLDMAPRQADGDLSPRRLQELTHALEAAELEHILIRVPLLATLQEHEVSELARAMQPAVLRDGDYVYRQGDAAKEFYIVLTGSVQKVVESGDGSKPGIPVGEPLGPASFFGQNSLLSDSQIRSCSMKVVGKTELRKLDRANMKTLVGDLQAVLKRDPVLYDKYQSHFEDRSSPVVAAECRILPTTAMASGHTAAKGSL